MQQLEDVKKIGDYLCFISESTKTLSNESTETLFSANTLKMISKCNNSLEFLQLIQSLNLPELQDKRLAPLTGENSASLRRLDVFLSKGELPADEQLSALVSDLQQKVRKDFADHVADGAMAGAAVGAAAGAVGGGLVTSPVGGVGASVGAMAGAVAGAVGGAVGGAVNWALGRD